MSAIRVNCHAKFSYQVQVAVPNAARQLAPPPTLGSVTGLLLRLSSSRGGPALNAAVDNLAATEASGAPGMMYVEVSKALHETWVLPLGKGTPFFGVWSKAGEFDMLSVEYTVDDGTLVK